MTSEPPSIRSAFPARTSMLDEPREYSLGVNAVEIRRHPKSVKEKNPSVPTVQMVPYSAITQIRLRYFPTRVQTNRYECIVSTRGHGEFKITNEIFKTIGTFEDRSAEFREFARELCRNVAEVNSGCTFVRGRSLLPYVLEHGFFIAMLAFLAWVLWLVGGALQGIAAVKMAILAFYIPFAVRYAIKNRPAPFDPRSVPDNILPK